MRWTLNNHCYCFLVWLHYSKEVTLHGFNLWKVIKTCFVDQYMVNSWEYSMSTWEECTLMLLARVFCRYLLDVISLQCCSSPHFLIDLLTSCSTCHCGKTKDEPERKSYGLLRSLWLRVLWVPGHAHGFLDTQVYMAVFQRLYTPKYFTP